MVKWLLDYDGCLADTFSAQLALTNAKFGTQYTEESFTAWATEEVMTEEECDYMWGTVFHDHAFQRSVHPVDSALGFVSLLRHLKHEMMIVSDRPESLYDVTCEWLAAYGMHDIPVLFTRNPHTKSDQHAHVPTKAEVADAEQFTYVIEDSGYNALSLANVSSVERVFLRRRTHNLMVKHPKITHVANWRQIQPHHIMTFPVLV